MEPHKPKSKSPDDLLTVEEAAAELRVSKSYLDKQRVHGNGPQFMKLGRRVRYRRADLHAWLGQRRFGSTSEYG